MGTAITVTACLLIGGLFGFAVGLMTAVILGEEAD